MVIKKTERLFGLKVKRIVDVLTTHSGVDLQASDRVGILGAFIDHEKIVVVIDALRIIDRFTEKSSDKLRRSFNGIKNQGRSNLHVLLAEDSPFFRDHITQILESSGYAVTSVVNGQLCLSTFERNPKHSFDVILSDLEMPIMGGLELAKKIRSLETGTYIPMIAVSSRFSKKDVADSVESGFDRHIEKLNATELLETMDQVLNLRGDLKNAG